jgi:hypothetical protein
MPILLVFTKATPCGASVSDSLDLADEADLLLQYHAINAFMASLRKVAWLSGRHPA